ncbi:MAG: site-specific DNA-methyltransferase [candidate division Zixibacteria bacterium]|nr:site-specific DNA-methyltransferase [candidate division Zixibacteria bacterium]
MNWPEDFINKIICGDNLSVMKKMPDESIDMAITSPPYWGLRDYGFEQIFGGDPNCKHTWTTENVYHDNLRFRDPNKTANVGTDKNPKIFTDPKLKQGDCIYCGAWKGQLGLEPTPELYIEHLTETFNEIKRILKKEGTLWLNIGDTYGGSQQGGGDTGLSKERHRKELLTYKNKPQRKLMPKCLLMIPERLTWSLIQNGWILRNKIIWFKPNSMPSSVKDRFNNKWEYLFLLSKNQKYYFDLDEVREPVKDPDELRYRRELRKNKSYDLSNQWKSTRWGDKGSMSEEQIEAGKNPGDVFEINTQAFPEAHFAVFPEKLCEKPIKAGCPEEICKKCGKARERIIEGTSPGAFNIRVRDVKKKRIKHTDRKASSEEIKDYKEGITHAGIGKYMKGWTDCNCKADFESGIVLDPFCGTGTALYVAKELRRRFIGIDIKKEYCELAEKRLAQGVL